MPPSDEELVSFTLRIPKATRDKLLVQAESKGKSLNSYIQTLLDTNLIESGYVGNHLVSISGRSFEIVFEPATDISNCFDPAGFFYLRELKFGKTRARYRFGLSEDLSEDWNVSKEARAQTVKAIGLALIAFYNKSIEIDCLSWPNPYVRKEYDGSRLLEASDVAPIGSVAEFLELLRQNKWTDPLVTAEKQSQDIRRGRNPSNLHR